VKELRGRRLGLPLHEGQPVDHGRASALRGFVSALRVAAIPTDAVSFVDLRATRLDLREDPATGVLHSRDRGPSFVEALASGAIDAAYVKGPPAIEQIRRHGLRVLFDLGAHPDLKVRINNAVPRPITADAALVAERPDIVARYLAVLIKTGHWAARNPEHTLRLVARETGSCEADAEEAYGPSLHKSLVPTLDERVVTGLAEQKRFLRDAGFLAADFDFDAWIAHEPLALAQRLVNEEPALIEALQASI